jgi:hypothetical protein
VWEYYYAVTNHRIVEFFYDIGCLTVESKNAVWSNWHYGENAKQMHNLRKNQHPYWKRLV